MTLPNFLIIGVAKAGTTSLFRYLDQHHQIFMCPIKGSNFFGYEDARDWKWKDEGDPPLLRHFQVKTRPFGGILGSGPNVILDLSRRQGNQLSIAHSCVNTILHRIVLASK